MPVPTDITAGTLTITNGSTAVTGVGTSWLASDLRQGDIIIWIEGGDGFQTPILADVPSSNTALTLAEPWLGPTLTGVHYRIRYQWDSSRVSAQSRQLIEMLDNGNVLALSGLTGPGIPVFNGPHSMVVRPETDFINGVAYDVQVDTLADRAAYDGQAEGFAVLVSDVGDGRSALYSKASNASGDWTDPAYITGPIGDTPDIEATVTNTAPGTTPTVTPVPITGGTRLDFTLPEASGFYNAGVYDIGATYTQDQVVRHNGSSFIALQAVPAGESPSGAMPPVDTAYWQVLAAKGQDGEIDGVTPFWQSRILNDADAAAARAGLGADNAENLLSGLLDVARVPDTLAADKAFRRGNILGPVSQSGGVPTGAIIERGSNANGEYVRYADGTQICLRTITFTGPITTPFGTLYNSALIPGPLFPATFVAMPEVSQYVKALTGASPWLVGSAASAASTSQWAGMYVMNPLSVSSSFTFTISLIAIGRWF